MFAIIKRDILILLRDRGNLFFVLIFPALLVFLLGNLLAQLDNADRPIKPFTIAYTIETKDQFSRHAIDALLAALDENANIDVKPSTDFNEAKKQVETNQAAAAVRFEEPFAISIYEGFDNIQNRAVLSIFQSFARETAAMSTLAENHPEKLQAAAQQRTQDLVKQQDFPYNRTMLDYYGVAMLVMILFMAGGIGGASSLYDSRKDGTLRRTLASPKSRLSLYIQSVLAATPQAIAQVLCVMIPSMIFFQVHYAGTLWDNFILFSAFFVIGLTINALFMVIGLFLKVNPTLVVMPIMWALMFISGTFSKEIYLPGITELSPIWQIQNAAFDLTVFGRPEKILTAMAISAVLLVIFIGVGGLLFRRKEVTMK